jgi:drug/metabolite transporter (DMT)-like permease
MALVFLLYALFASCFTIAKTGLEYTQPLFLVGSRMMLAGLVLLGYLSWKNESIKLKKEGLFFLLSLAAVNIYLTNAFEFWGLQHLTSFKTCFLYSLSPFFAALFSYIVFSEKMNKKKWIGVVIGFIGFVPALMNQSEGEEALGQLLFLSWAEISVMMAAICTVFGWVSMRKVVRDHGYSPMLANGWSMLIGGAMALSHSILTENWDPVPVTQWTPFLECFFLLFIISNMIGYNLYGYLLKRFTATFMSFAGFTTPVFCALWGWMFLGETVPFDFYISACIVFLGLYIFNQEELKQGYTQAY